MTLIPRSLTDWFRSFFRGGLHAVAVEEAAVIKAGVLEAEAKVFEKAVEIARQTKPLRESDDELEKYLAQEFAATLRETLQLGRTMLTPMTPEERAEALTRPLPDSGGSPSSLPPADPAALPSPQPGPVPPRRGPGRPPGSKNRPKAGQGEANGQVGSPTSWPD